MTPEQKENLRSIPSVTSLLEGDEVTDWLAELPRGTIVSALQEAVEQIRQRILDDVVTDPVDAETVLALAEQIVTERLIPSLRRVLNATGIVLHTGLGRAPLSEAAIEAIVEGASGYTNLEYDLDTGGRGRRTDHVTDRLASLTGAQAATVVNNNAAATYLVLRVLAENREVIVSRGELVEIGGSFRLPDIMGASGAVMKEVGTTNRTYIADYERAVTDSTAILLRVHTSNYRVVGFTESVPIGKLVDLAHRYNLIAVDDLGSGALFDIEGLPPEPSVRDSIADGADLVCFSGDKLLGGPQCGIIVGARELIDKLTADPLMRTYRVDKLTLLALEATLRSYDDAADAVEHIPTLSMLGMSSELLAKRANALADMLGAALPSERFLVCSDVGFAGGGSMPGEEMETVVLQWRPTVCSVTEMMRQLRDADVPVIARVRDETICFDLRTIPQSDFEILVQSVSDAVWERAEASDCGVIPPTS